MGANEYRTMTLPSVPVIPPEDVTYIPGIS
jgi:hypothetical protein